MGLYHDVTEDAKMNLVAVQIPLLIHRDRPLTNHPVRFFVFFAFHTKFIILTVPICVFIKLDSMNHKNANDGPHGKLSEFKIR